MNKWTTWVRRKYNLFRGDDLKSVSEYSVWLKVSQPTVSAWLNGTRGAPTSRKIINALYDRYGDEIYDVLDIPRYKELDPEFADIFQKLRALPPKEKAALAPKLRAYFENVLAELERERES